MNRYADIRSCARSVDCDAARAADHALAEGATIHAACGQNSAGEKIYGYSVFLACVHIKRMFDFYWLFGDGLSGGQCRRICRC